ncbi:putative short-chain dehydrogenase [Diaporthe ampelina]|uniref:Putative short-chain dehydrogenase n=1 Tax=Diaporthe ampelina TaxID=1214573 RepID=A0A0G2FK47_9PEZI|nr:putative short-chain dehydrogenase [Diaporthe ampelina]
MRTRQVALNIWPELVDDDVRRIYWEDAVHKLKRHLAKAPLVPEHGDGSILACDATPDQDGLDQATKEYVAATSLKKPERWEQLKCYICRLRIHKPHRIFSAMCEPCGEFNLAGSSASLPHNLRLEGRTALVTGARVNLGFHVVLRLLRCGASVIASTRYPRDAVARYLQQADSADWVGRLRVVGADFRTASDAFALVLQTKSILHEWGSGLDVLINNAAQTLTDSVEMEESAVTRETALKGRIMPMLAEGGYEARVWRGALANNVLEDAGPQDETRGGNTTGTAPAKEATSEALGLESLTLAHHVFEKGRTVVGAIVKRPEPSSWVQSLSDIPYGDVITAHSINTFVPLILIRELLPLMDHRKHGDSNQENNGHIINVSSREGIFEASPRHGAKNGKHVHTNMSKAGLNMITETEASTAWQKYKVCVNTVDPGFMSAAPEFEKAYGGERPLSWEDGAGRVLWPIAMAEGSQGGERKKDRMGSIWGRFLKHYGAVRVDPRVGRG